MEERIILVSLLVMRPFVLQCNICKIDKRKGQNHYLDNDNLNKMTYH